ncbi:hypothetical protein SNEBB_001028 [Seison nebaliae]|nr:hypothetical protein SNEBB_001028 [Seison nebaliae]
MEKFTNSLKLVDKRIKTEPKRDFEKRPAKVKRTSSDEDELELQKFLDNKHAKKKKKPVVINRFYKKIDRVPSEEIIENDRDADVHSLPISSLSDQSTSSCEELQSISNIISPISNENVSGRSSRASILSKLSSHLASSHHNVRSKTGILKSPVDKLSDRKSRRPSTVRTPRNYVRFKKNRSITESLSENIDENLTMELSTESFSDDNTKSLPMVSKRTTSLSSPSLQSLQSATTQRTMTSETTSDDLTESDYETETTSSSSLSFTRSSMSTSTSTTTELSDETTLPIQHRSSKSSINHKSSTFTYGESATPSPIIHRRIPTKQSKIINSIGVQTLPITDNNNNNNNNNMRNDNSNYCTMDFSSYELMRKEMKLNDILMKQIEINKQFLQMERRLFNVKLF